MLKRQQARNPPSKVSLIKKRPMSQTAEVQTMPLCSLHRAPDITTIKNSSTNTMPQALCLK